jgi:uncharacterized membrane protein YccC
MPRRSFGRQLGALFESGAAGPAIGAGMRAAAATVLPLLFGELTGQPAFLTMALGGYFASLADPGGPYRSRANHLIAFLLGGVTACLLGGFAARHPLLALPLLFSGAFLCGMARALGDSAGTVGGLLLMLFAVVIGTPSSSGGGALHAVLLRTGLFAAGALVAMVLALSLWPIHPYRPVRLSLATSYRALAAYARELLFLTGAEELAWDALARRSRARIRDNLERTRRVLFATRGLRQAETARGELLLALHETADLMLGGLSAVGESMRLAPHGNIEDEQRALSLFAGALESVAESVTGAKVPLDASTLEAARHALRRERGELAALVDRLLGSAVLAVELAESLRTGTETTYKSRGLSPQPQQRGPLAALRAELNPGSLVLRHALRVATAATAAQALATALHLTKAHWVTVTVIIVLQPSSGASFRKGLQRVAGTVLGGLVAALLSAVAPSPVWLAVILFPLSAAAVSLLPINYGLFAILITPCFVLMSEAVAGDWHLTRVRMLNTLLGGAIALVSAALLWPSWERQRRGPLLAQLFEALSHHLRTASAGRPAEERNAARRQVGLAAGLAEASLQRALTEPNAREMELESMMAILAHARRFAGATNALAEMLPMGAQLTPHQRAFVDKLAAALAELSRAALEERAPAPLPFSSSMEVLRGEGEGEPTPQAALLERLARQIRVLHSALTRLSGGAADADSIDEPAPAS